MLRQTKDPRFTAWWGVHGDSLPLHADRNAASKVWQAALDNKRPEGLEFGEWWPRHVLARASCFPIHINAAQFVWAAAQVAV